MPDVTIRPASLDDTTAIARCIRASFRRYIDRIGRPPRPMLYDYAQVIATKRVFVAESGDELAGVLVLATTDEGFKLDIVAVEPGLQRTGIGRTLIDFAEAQAKHAGYDAIHLTTLEAMTENLALYGSLGYDVCDRRVEDGHARIYMRKRLD
jgi:ribosomal protein S18 acetylase RimI-like enzyme